MYVCVCLCVCAQSHRPYNSPDKQWQGTKKIGGVVVQLSHARRRVVWICSSRFEIFDAAT